MKVLVADDDVTNILIFHQVLSERGHDVVLATGGKNCISLYQKCMEKVGSNPDDPLLIQPFDAVMIDYQILEPSSLEIAKEILTISSSSKNNICFFIDK